MDNTNMEKYIAKVFSNDQSLSWWDNFLSSVPTDTKLNDDLKEHNARDVPDSDSIEFETEEDFLIFKLKFS